MRRVLTVVLLTAVVLAIATATAGARVLLVGSFHGVKGQYSSIQAAVNAARPGDWILVGPGDYKTKRIHAPKGFANRPAAVLITTPRIKLRGMNRNSVIVDGTTRGPTCNARPADQNLGPNSKSGRLGLNGIMVWKADSVWIQNLTACNFLGGAGHAGNEIWWNGGDDSQRIGGWGYLGSYLTATSTYFAGETSAAQYGIFSSNWDGGTWDQTYSSNFNDSGYYIGACQQECNQVIDHAWAEYSALGYSGSNSGGSLIIENSQFDHNQDGFDTNSQNGDNPPPQDGTCPDDGISPITHSHSCWVFMHNYSHDNNNYMTPSAGSAAAGPVGTGMSISGGRNDTVMDSTFANNGAWGVILVAYPDSGPPCTGGVLNELGPGSCLFDEWGDALIDNTFRHNGYFGHPSNGDFQQLKFLSGNPTNCFRGNQDTSGSLGADDTALEQQEPDCNGATTGGQASDPNFLNEVLCDSGVSLGSGPPSCPSGSYHPPIGQNVVMHPLPRGLKSMPNPCQGVPANAWCRRGKPIA